MPLSEPAPREPMHTRRIECQAFRRQDGLWDIEGELVDTRSWDSSNAWRGEIPAGTPVHGMRLRLTVDRSFVIRAVDVAMDDHPFPGCSEIEPAYEQLVGLTIGPGFSHRCRRLFGGTRGCTHVSKLLENLATATLQAMGPVLSREARARGEDLHAQRKPFFLDGCHALASDSETVREYFPRWYRGERSVGDD